MFVRFVTPELHKQSHQEIGVFQAVFDLRDDGRLSSDEESHLEELRHWFGRSLSKPSKFTNAKPPHYRRRQNGISWFKDSATVHIAKLWELVAILKNHDISVQMIKTERPGYVVYEDEFQVVAVPFSESAR